MSVKSAAPCVTDLKCFPSKETPDVDPEAVDRVGEEKHLDATRAEAFEMRGGFETSEIVPRQIIDRGLILLQTAECNLSGFARSWLTLSS